jgi:hypothetical protein
MDNITGWRTSTRSMADGNCVEVGAGTGWIAVRDSKNRDAGYFAVASRLWSTFVACVKRGDFDL